MKSEDILKELESCKNPLFFYDDDCDGLCSFLLLYKYLGEGHGIPVKKTPLDETFLRKIEEYNPDKIFILDIPTVSSDFLDEVKIPIVWIDHHPGKFPKRDNLIYHNPRVDDPNLNKPTSELCYEIVNTNLWIAMTGVVSDWVFNEKMVNDFRKDYENLLPKEIDSPEKALFETKIGFLGKIFNFILMGRSRDVRKYVNILTRINDPYEILDKTSSRGKYIFKKYSSLSNDYDTLFEKACSNKSDSPFLVFTYSNGTSYTSLLSNELLYKYNDKIILVARDSDEYYKGSLRSPKNIIINTVLEKALEGLTDCHGGGHENACGYCVRKEDWKTFLKNLDEALPK